MPLPLGCGSDGVSRLICFGNSSRRDISRQNCRARPWARCLIFEHSRLAWAAFRLRKGRARFWSFGRRCKMGEDAARCPHLQGVPPPGRPPLAQEIRIEFTRFSAFYSPLIATFAGGFLQQEGLTPKHSVSAPGKSAIAGLADGSVHVGQSAPSAWLRGARAGQEAACRAFRPDQREGRLLPRRPQPRQGVQLGQAQGQEA